MGTDSLLSVAGNDVLEVARRSRDPGFDGRFFVGVTSTGIYCRPVCPVKLPKQQNVRFFPSAALASEAGFRPCLRCRPESAPGTPAWQGNSTTVNRAMELINQGALDGSGLEPMCERLGVSSRYLGQLFKKHLGLSPGRIARTRRLQFARKLLTETGLSVTEIAFASGYQSVRRFNDHFRQVYDRSPSTMRRTQQVTQHGTEGSAVSINPGITLHLSYRPPLDFEAMLEFLSRRAIPGVESVAKGEFQRVETAGKSSGVIRVSHVGEENAVLCSIELADTGALLPVTKKVRSLFDLDAVPQEIERHLCQDRQLSNLIKRQPGLRLPGAWDPFEVAIRAIVGQQISIVAASTIMAGISERFGEECPVGRQFPSAEKLADLNGVKLPMPASRTRTLEALARAVVDGSVDFSQDPDSLYQQLVSLRGIGPWTAGYITMRVSGDPDRFLDTDLVVQKAARIALGIQSHRELLERAKAWRPWGSYVVMYLWQFAGNRLNGS